MATTAAAVLKRLEAEEERRKAGDVALRARADELEGRVSALEKPSPVPPEPPLATGWKVVFKDEFANGLDNFYLGSDNDTRPMSRGDGTCAFVLDGGQDRSELAVHTPEWTEGQRLLIKQTFIVPKSFPYGGPGSHCTIQQFRQNTSAGSPLLSLELGDYGEGNGLYLHDKTITDQYIKAIDAPGLERLPLETAFEIGTSRTGNGYYKLSIFGRPDQIDRHRINTIPPEASYAYIKTGLYRAPIWMPSNITIRDFSLSVPA